jgi:hypothetical protein
VASGSRFRIIAQHPRDGPLIAADFFWRDERRITGPMMRRSFSAASRDLAKEK